MAVTVSSFKAAFPEFANADSDLVTEHLERASRVTPEAVWGDLLDDGIKLRTARSLAKSPYSRGMELVSKDGSTVYDAHLEELMTAVCGGGLAI